jgi:hypothetical protein
MRRLGDSRAHVVNHIGSQAVRWQAMQRGRWTSETHFPVGLVFCCAKAKSVRHENQLAKGGKSWLRCHVKIIANLAFADCAPTHIRAGEQAFALRQKLKKRRASPGKEAL